MIQAMGEQEARMRESTASRKHCDRAPSDEHELALIRAVARGDRAAFGALHTRYHGLLMRFLVRSTSRRDLVEEVVNDTLWAVWRSASRFRGDSKPRSWVMAIAYRSLMKALRDRPLQAGAMPSTAADGGGDGMAELVDASSDIARAEARDWIRRGLDLLPTEQRVTLELAYFLGQSCEEIAVIMDCAVGTVKARMFHARVRLRNTLPALGGEPEPTNSPKTA
ncbi:RNA polymerase sigma-70 factor, ECF subfamily [Dokdonella immobilis]|uniref:RNA polymerase sigma-70 factor, ECF subfamily n=2 Tax=Dokdonella immobilis TaxID=578942 RepID=A0A1I4YZU6_9GAMM|nr:RNA polymerase sigma-70 factor, ECF subfamily [Dokdonella immobilis]